MGRVAAITCVAALAMAGCGSDRATRGERTVEVVATVAPVSDIIRNAGAGRVRVTLLVPRGADPHEWRPDRRHREALAEAELVVRAGGGLDDWAAGSGAARELELLPLLDPLGDDPHWWHDPQRAQRAAKEIRNELARIDVDGAGHYEAATADYLERLRELDREIRACMRFVPTGSRRLAVGHDAFAYLRARYALPLVDGGGRGASVGRRLWGDTLAPPGHEADSYLGAMSLNVETIVQALTDGRRTCRPRP